MVVKVHEAAIAFVDVPLVSAKGLNWVTVLLIVGALLQGDPNLEFNVISDVTRLPPKNLYEDRVEASL